MDISTSTTTVVTITLTEGEARTALVEPQELQAAIRVALAPVAAARQTRQSVRLGKRRDPKDTGLSIKKSTSTKERIPCKHCKKSVAPKYMALHLRKKHPDVASAETD